MSTIGKTCIGAIAAGLSENGIASVDAPVSDGPPAAREGRLTIMASGPEEAGVAVVKLYLGLLRRFRRLAMTGEGNSPIECGPISSLRQP